jgi:hypothetical protein
MKVEFWIKSSRGTDERERIVLPDDVEYNDIKASLINWLHGFRDWEITKGDYQDLKIYEASTFGLISGKTTIKYGWRDMRKIDKMCELYIKEREYQKSIFGEYSNNPNFNVATFLQFIEHYLEKSKKAYVSKWTKERPEWLKDCTEFLGEPDERTAPIEAYEQLVKIFTLAGAALESFTDIDIDKWREKGIKDKWREDETRT